MNDQSSPLVYLCVPTHNSGLTLSETLDSLLEQTYQNICILLIDNASEDNTVDIANQYVAKTTKMQVLSFQKNVGGEGNFTRCIQLAAGDYMAIYHSDDVYEKTMVAEQVAFLENNKGAGAVFTSAMYIDGNGKAKGFHKIPNELTQNSSTVYQFNEVFSLVLKHMNFFMCPSAMLRTAVYKNDIQCFQGSKFHSSSDLDVWFRVAEKYGVGIINKPLMRYRISNASYTYHYLRTRTAQHDIFLVLDFYINKYRNVLQESDLNNYHYLLFKENINRSISFIIQNQRKCARGVLLDAFKMARKHRSVLNHQKITFTGIIVYIISLFPIGSVGRRFLYYIRFEK